MESCSWPPSGNCPGTVFFRAVCGSGLPFSNVDSSQGCFPVGCFAIGLSWDNFPSSLYVTGSVQIPLGIWNSSRTRLFVPSIFEALAISCARFSLSVAISYASVSTIG